MPKLWTETIETHRREVRDATLDTAATLVAERGLLSVTMSQIAKKTGIGRATLYHYFPDVEAILVAWHERRLARHLEQLAAVRDRSGDADERLAAVLETYALILHGRSHEHYGGEIAALVHTTEHVARAQRRLGGFFRDLLIEAAKTGNVRKDVAPTELVSYCLHALAAARDVPTKTAVGRLVEITLAGLRPPH